MRTPAARTLATNRSGWLTLALFLLALLPTGPAFVHAAYSSPSHHSPSPHPRSHPTSAHHAAALLQQVSATPQAALHAEHPAPPCCLGATCVELVPMPAVLAAGEPAFATRPASYPPANAASVAGLEPSPVPRPPRRAS